MGQTVAVILAGGRGKRVGAGRNKVLIELVGRPVIEWSIAAFVDHPLIDRVVLVGHRDDLADLQAIAARLGVTDLITGGAERPDSERAALDLLREDIAAGRVDCVVIHDGARPCVDANLIERTVAVARVEGAVPTVQAPPLVIDDGQQIAPARGHLLRAQTPQGGPAKWLLSAYDAALDHWFTGTDTASYLEHAGHPVRALPGESTNLKVTYADDLAAATEILAGRRAGG